MLLSLEVSITRYLKKKVRKYPAANHDDGRNEQIKGFVRVTDCFSLVPCRQSRAPKLLQCIRSPLKAFTEMATSALLEKADRRLLPWRPYARYDGIHNLLWHMINFDAHCKRLSRQATSAGLLYFSQISI